jgi:dUTP pyrophosphatase
MQVKIVNKSTNEMPAYATAGAAGFDLRANLKEPVTLKPLERKLIPTGIFMEIPLGYEGQVRPRSGLALKRGLTVLNSPGTVDADYRGEVGVILVNLSSEDQTFEHGERIAQMVIAKHERPDLFKVESVEELESSERGAGGFGSTGIK